MLLREECAAEREDGGEEEEGEGLTDASASESCLYSRGLTG